MANSIEFAKNYTGILDEVYQRAAVSRCLNSGGRMVRAGRNAKEILIPKISVTGLGDYTRNVGYKTGSITYEYETHSFNFLPNSGETPRGAEGAHRDHARVQRGEMMRGLRPIPVRLLADDAVVRVPDGDGGYAEGVAVSRVRFARTQSATDDDHGSADAGAGKVYVDAVNSAGAFEVPAGSRIDIGEHSPYVAECRRREDFNGHVHHWELVVR